MRKASAAKRSGLKGKAVWCGHQEAGMTRKSVAEYVERMYEANLNTIVVHLKGGGGDLFWPSKLFPEAVAPGYESFDLPAALLAECRKRGMQMHVWFIDYFEGANGVAYKKHPDWAALSPKGLPTSEEILRGRKFGAIWMCPARRPGYTDQWLVPAIEEFARMYDVDAMHHDYIRYPGDIAPDTYCFCDYCLEQIPKFNSYYYETYPNEPFHHHSYDRAHLEAHWEPGPRVLPANWDRLPREMKGRFLLHGSFFQGGLYDLDYFFYTYRTYWVTRFAREAAEAVRKVKPKMEMSAAVFKNPIHSGRFIGQDWRTWAPYVEYCMPMNYRDHIPGDFETYLHLLREVILRQKNDWARDFKHFWPGFAVNMLFDEEERPLARLQSLLDGNASAPEIEADFEKIAPRLKIAARDLHGRIRAWLKKSGQKDFEKERRGIAADFSAFRKNIPPSYWPKEKLVRTIECVKATGVEGLVMFCEGHLPHYGLYDVVKEAFSDTLVQNKICDHEIILDGKG